jgi:hypothetical protein
MICQLKNQLIKSGIRGYEVTEIFESDAETMGLLRLPNHHKKLSWSDRGQFAWQRELGIDAEEM